LFAAVFVVEMLIYFTGFFFRKELPDEVMTAILLLCGTWYIELLYVTMFLFAMEAVNISNRLRPWYPARITAHWGQTKLTLFCIAIGGVNLLAWHGYNVVMHPVVTHVNITLPRADDAGRDSMTVVMISDLHIGEIIGRELVEKYVALSNAQHPDLVLLAGDLLDYESRFAENAHVEEVLQQLEAPLGVYAVNGNHEYRANRHAKTKWIRSAGVTLLVDSTVLIDDMFYLVGRDDFINRERRPLQALVKGLDRSKPIVVLDHQPWSFAEMVMNDVQLGLHGHTHNGQWWPYPLLMKFIYECPYGYYRKAGTQFYVSSGIGISGPPYRVGTVSELVALHIRYE
jgi:predicted MPP superfamily phosphohydrolase